MEDLNKTIRALKKEIKLLKKQLRERDAIFIEGNKGANVVDIYKLDDNRIEIKIGDCCVYTIHSILTAEAFTSFLTNIFFESGKHSFLDFVYDNLRWPKETGYNDEIIKNCKDLNKRN